jgi:hypothetical protein
LYLPRFASRRQLHEALWPLIEGEAEHKGFYEWKGAV